MINVLEFILVIVISVAMLFFVVAQSFIDVSKGPPFGVPVYVYALLPIIYLIIRLLIWFLMRRRSLRSGKHS
ncbi:hypothetical protein [Bosea sp. PAMC 26642]|uniref:hypothetical protein n=1 Tax=Bosea sp. (strain PAMC 26642) TaxID=1792307 RepID=UPI00077057D2|nr:hypothetical protein [Bosea sp. PAMC 26642]AMJ62409.1 hypothetical protein AXW83_20780 [Bosea sp. PAMC 26642]